MKGKFFQRSEGKRLEVISGYESSRLLEVIESKTLISRDSDYDNAPGALRLVVGLLLSRSDEEVRPVSVLDFGGALGTHFRQASRLGIDLKWAIVETKSMVEKGNASFSNDRLRFFTDIEEAADYLGPSLDLLYSSSALQYVPNPEATLKKLVSLGPKVIAWSRLSLGSHVETLVRIQRSRLANNGPGPLPPEFQDAWVEITESVMPRSFFLDAHAGYDLFTEAAESDEGYVFLLKT